MVENGAGREHIATMKITGTGGAGPQSLKRAGKRREVGAGERFRAAVEAQRPAVPAAGAAAPAPAVNPLLALQELPDATAQRARAVRRGHDLLAQLDRIRHALLIGRIAPSELTRLLATVRQRRQDLADPQLAGLLDEIELRAAVELAKFDFV